MIKNEKQLGITSGLLSQLRDSLAKLEELPEDRNKRWLRKAQKDAIQAQMIEFQRQMDEYLAYKTRKKKPQSLDFLEQIPILLIRWRIYRGLTQEKLANRLGWHYQQLQQYEKTNYETATLQTILKVASALSSVSSTHLRDENTQDDRSPVR